VRGYAGVDEEATAWDAIFRHFNRERGRGDVGYRSGEKIAIKINLVACFAKDQRVDASYDKLDSWKDNIDNTPDLLHALQVRLPPSDSLRAHEVIFSSELTDFYAWAIPKPDCVLVGSAFADTATARPRFDKLVQVMCRNHGLRHEILSRSARPLSRPGTRDHLLHGGAGILLAGEAAGLISPSSGEGISYAVESGAAAGRALTSEDPARAYVRDFDRIALKVCAKFLKARTIFTPWTRRLAMRLPWCP